MNTLTSQFEPIRRLQSLSPWRQAISALALLIVWILVLYRDTGIGMVTIWARSETFTHAFLVLPISLWLIWRKRQDIALHMPDPSRWILVLVASAAFIWLLADMAAINALTQLSFVTLLILTVPAVLGLAISRLILFPLAYLYFSVPVGEFLLPQFMEWTANFTVFAVRLSGVPVFREGLQFVIPSGNWSVVEACSGIRYLISSVTVGALFAYLNYQSMWRRVVFVIVSICVPVIANWLRAYMIVMLGHISGNKLAVGVDHLIYGWVFFGVVILLMFFVGSRWAEPEMVKAVFNPLTSQQKKNWRPERLWINLLSVLVMVTLPFVALLGMDRQPNTNHVTLTAPKILPPNWQMISADLPNFKPAFENPSAEFNTGYLNDGNKVAIYIAYYRNQNYERKLVNSNNVLVRSGDRQWTQVASKDQLVKLEGQTIMVRRTELKGAASVRSPDGERLIAWQIYWINGALTSSDYVAKAYSALYRLIGRGDDGAVLVLYTGKDQVGGADALLNSFLTSNFDAIREVLMTAQKSK
jgi:exosortase A